MGKKVSIKYIILEWDMGAGFWRILLLQYKGLIEQNENDKLKMIKKRPLFYSDRFLYYLSLPVIKRYNANLIVTTRYLPLTGS